MNVEAQEQQGNSTASSSQQENNVQNEEDIRTACYSCIEKAKSGYEAWLVAAYDADL